MLIYPKKWFRNFVTWDKLVITRFQQRRGLSNYQILWIAFAKGILIGITIGLLL